MEMWLEIKSGFMFLWEHDVNCLLVSVSAGSWLSTQRWISLKPNLAETYGVILSFRVHRMIHVSHGRANIIHHPSSLPVFSSCENSSDDCNTHVLPLHVVRIFKVVSGFFNKQI